MSYLFASRKTIVAGVLAMLFVLAMVQFKIFYSKAPSNLLSYGIIQDYTESRTAQVEDYPVLQPRQSSLEHLGHFSGSEETLTHMQMENIVRDLRNFLVSSFHSSLAETSNEKAAAVISKSREFLRVLEAKLNISKALSGLQRRVDAKLKALQNHVQRTIHALQHPSDCKKAPKLLCTLDNPWGFAAGMHDVLWCFVAALRMGRTVILDSSKWHHAPGDDWSKMFAPVTGETCVNVSLADAVTGYPGYDSAPKERAKILEMPSAIAGTLLSNHGTPYAWWYGQIMAYVLRLQDSTQEKIDEFKRVHGFEHPIVAVHIRQTDKKKEAAYHGTEQYMSHVEEFYLKLSLTRPVTKRRVFVATDEPEVIAELKARFPKYTFIYDKGSVEEAHDPRARTLSSALFGIVRDVYLLAESDFLVCTFSSGFCRIAFELMQTLHTDATPHAVSVDVDYFYGYVPFPPRRALFRNRAHLPDELSFDVGQLIEKPEALSALKEAKHKDFCDGYQRGRIVGSTEAGEYPTYKTAQTYNVVKYAAFNDTEAYG